MAILEIAQLSYRYGNGTLALDGISLAVETGECVAISGENGAGKSTLLKSIMGLLKLSQGSICLYGEDIARSSTARLARKLGFVFQNPRNQIFLSSVIAEVSFGPRRLGMSPAEIAKRAKQALSVTGLEGLEETHPYDLSPGQRKLLAITCALALEPQILILDEPTSGMDFSEAERARQVMLSYLAQGRTVILATHDMDLAARCRAAHGYSAARAGDRRWRDA